MRGKRLNAKLIGSMRICMTLSCNSRVLRASCDSPWRRRSRSFGSMPSAKLESIDCVMSSSPTKLMMLSTFSVATRMDPESPDAFCTGAPAGGLRSASAGATAFASLGDTAFVPAEHASIGASAACGCADACAPGTGAAGADPPMGVNSSRHPESTQSNTSSSLPRGI